MALGLRRQLHRDRSPYADQWGELGSSDINCVVPLRIISSSDRDKDGRAEWGDDWRDRVKKIRFAISGGLSLK